VTHLGLSHVHMLPLADRDGAKPLPAASRIHLVSMLNHSSNLFTSHYRALPFDQHRLAIARHRRIPAARLLQSSQVILLKCRFSAPTLHSGDRAATYRSRQRKQLPRVTVAFNLTSNPAQGLRPTSCGRILSREARQMPQSPVLAQSVL